MSQLLELEIDILFRLWALAQRTSKPQSRNDILEREKKAHRSTVGPVSTHRVNIAIDSLFRRSYIIEADIDEKEEILYSISLNGTRWLEDWYKIIENEQTYTLHRRYNEVVLSITQDEWIKKNNPVSSIQPVASAETGVEGKAMFWTKWAAILTGIGIVVAIIIAAVKP